MFGCEEFLIWAGELPLLAGATQGQGSFPLVVFLPGGGHLARIAYGHAGSLEREFLVYWLADRGFGSLALSYPGGHPVFPSAYPELTPKAWGAAAAQATADYIRRRGLSSNIVLCVWSMSGRAVHAYARAAAEHGLLIDVCVSLAASAPLPGLLPSGDEPLTSAGLWDIGVAANGRPSRRSLFIDELRAREGSVVISEDDYLAHYMNPHAVGLRGEAQRWRDSGSVRDPLTAQEDIGVGRWQDFPICGAIVPTDQRDLRHALTDHLSWTLFTAQGIAARLQASGRRLEPAAWSALRQIVDDLPRLLVRYASGGHLFFVGRTGAQQTARYIEELWTGATEISHQIASLTATSQPE